MVLLTIFRAVPIIRITGRCLLFRKSQEYVRDFLQFGFRSGRLTVPAMAQMRLLLSRLLLGIRFLLGLSIDYLFSRGHWHAPVRVTVDQFPILTATFALLAAVKGLPLSICFRKENATVFWLQFFSATTDKLPLCLWPTLADCAKSSLLVHFVREFGKWSWKGREFGIGYLVYPLYCNFLTLGEGEF